MSEELKKLVGERAADMVEDGMIVGLGTGSTAKYAILRLGERMRAEGIKIVGISTSKASSELARKEGIPLSTLEEHQEIDLTIDGADEVDTVYDRRRNRWARQQCRTVQTGAIAVASEPAK